MFQTPKERNAAFTNYRGYQSPSDDESMIMSPNCNSSPDDRMHLRTRTLNGMDWDDGTAINNSHRIFSTNNNKFVGGLNEVYDSPFFNSPKNHYRHKSEGRTNNNMTSLNWPTNTKQSETTSPLSSISFLKISDHQNSPHHFNHYFQQQQTVPSTFNKLMLTDSMKFDIHLNDNGNSNSRWYPKAAQSSIFSDNFLKDLSTFEDKELNKTNSLFANDDKSFVLNTNSSQFVNGRSQTAPLPLPSSSSLFFLPFRSSPSAPPPSNFKQTFPTFATVVKSPNLFSNAVNNNNNNKDVTFCESKTNGFVANTKIDHAGDVDVKDVNPSFSRNALSPLLQSGPALKINPNLIEISDDQEMKIDSANIPKSDDEKNENDVIIVSDNKVRMRRMTTIKPTEGMAGGHTNASNNVYFIRRGNFFTNQLSKKRNVIAFLFLISSLIFLKSFFFNSWFDATDQSGYDAFVRYSHVNFSLIESNLRSKLFGQHIATDAILSSFKEFLNINLFSNQKEEVKNEHNLKRKKVLSLIFLGSSGIGKSYAGSLIMDGFLDDKATHLIIIPLHFSYLFTKYNINNNNNNNYDDDVGDDGNDYEGFIKKESMSNNDEDQADFKMRISQLISDYKYDNDKRHKKLLLFLIEGLDDVIDDGEFTSQLIDTINSLNHGEDEDDDDSDGYKYIFIITSNAIGSIINSITSELLVVKGKQRTEINMDMIMEDQRVKSGLLNSWFFKAFCNHTVDKLIPFLPLEKDHVKKCIDTVLLGKNLTVTNNINFVDSVFKSIGNHPGNETAIFSLAGCRNIPAHVDLLLAGFQ